MSASVTCSASTRPVLGTCVTLEVASAYCGVFASATLAGCIAREPCRAGAARDVSTGACVDAVEVRASAQASGLSLEPDEHAACDAGHVLATSERGGVRRLACVTPSMPARRLCPRGAVSDDAGACVVVVRDGAVDVASWTRAVLGADGGKASALFCDALARAPSALTGAAPDVVLDLTLLVPANDVSQARARMRSVPASAELTAELEATLAPYVDALRSMGGVSTSAAVSARLRCGRRAVRPHAEPAPAP